MSLNDEPLDSFLVHLADARQYSLEYLDVATVKDLLAKITGNGNILVHLEMFAAVAPIDIFRSLPTSNLGNERYR